MMQMCTVISIWMNQLRIVSPHPISILKLLDLRPEPEEEFFMNGVKKEDKTKIGETFLGYVIKPVHFEPCKWINIGNNLVKDIFNMI
jgi:hypothetical protein